MRRKRFEFVLEAAQPIAHHEETIGNEAVIMRRKVRYAGGWSMVPVVTADTMRHGMREAAAYALLDAAGLLEEAKLSQAALRLLFAGGMVTGRGNAAVIKLDRYRELCELVPSMALFGGCCDNRVIPGRLTVDDATLVCEETERYVPEWIVEFVRDDAGMDGGRAHVEEVQRVRMDPTLHPQKMRLLDESAQVEVSRRLQASEQASADRDAVTTEREKSSMMPRRFERIAQGSLFAWGCEAIINTDLDLDTYHVAVAAFLASACVGGKRGTGHGRLRPLAAQEVRLANPARELERVDTTALAPRVGELFRNHVTEKAAHIADFLRSVNA